MTLRSGYVTSTERRRFTSFCPAKAAQCFPVVHGSQHQTVVHLEVAEDDTRTVSTSTALLLLHRCKIVLSCCPLTKSRRRRSRSHHASRRPGDGYTLLEGISSQQGTTQIQWLLRSPISRKRSSVVLLMHLVPSASLLLCVNSSSLLPVPLKARDERDVGRNGSTDSLLE